MEESANLTGQIEVIVNMQRKTAKEVTDKALTFRDLASTRRLGFELINMANGVYSRDDLSCFVMVEVCERQER